MRRKFGQLTGYEVDGQAVTLNFEGQRAEIRVLTSCIINVFCSMDHVRRGSKAIEGDKTVPTPVQAGRGEDGLWIHTGEVSVRVSDGFYVDFYDRDGAEVCVDYRGGRKPLQRVSQEVLKLLEEEGHSASSRKQEHAFEVLKKIEASQHFYGLGDKTGFLDKRHYEYEMWNTDNPDPQVDSFKALYKSIPFFISLTDSHVYGLFLDNTFKSYFNMGQESEEYYWFGADGGNLDYY